MKRYETLQNRLDEINPHYRFEVSTGPTAANTFPTDVIMSYVHGNIRIDVYPKHAGALDEEPIAVTLIVDPENRALQDAIDYGLGAHLPPESIISNYVQAPFGLAGSITDAQFHLKPIDTELAKPIPVGLDIMHGEERLASYPIRLTKRTMGDKGSIHTGADSTGWLNAEIKLDRDAQEVEIGFQLTPKPAMTTSLLPLCRWLRECQPSRSLIYRFPDGTNCTSELPAAFPNNEVLCQIIEGIEEIQNHSGIYIEMPIPLTPEEQQLIVGTANLLRTKCVDITWKAQDLYFDNVKDTTLETLRNDHLHSLILERDWSLKIGETVFPIGRVRDYFESARMTIHEDNEQDLKPGSKIHLQLSPGSNNKGQRTLLG